MSDTLTVLYWELTHHHLPIIMSLSQTEELILYCIYDWPFRAFLDHHRLQMVLMQKGFLLKIPTCYEVCVLTDCFSCWLVALKSKLAVTASIHVYSIQKAMLKDSGPLFNTDYDILKSNLQNCSKWAP